MGKKKTTKKKTTKKVDTEPTGIGDNLKRIDMSPVTEFLSTGCTVLDLAIADQLPGGFPLGRISHVFGKESTGKTALACEAAGSVQRQGGCAYFEDAEHTFDTIRAQSLYGVNVDDTLKLKWELPTTVEMLFDEQIASVISAQEKIKGPKGIPPALVVVDSLSALPAQAELDKSLGEQGYGTRRARQLSAAFRKIIWPVSMNNIAILFIDQARVNLGAMWGDKMTTGSGEAIKFYASTQVKLIMKGRIVDASKKVVGVKVKFTIVKNKVAPPFRQGEFNFLFSYGIDDVASNLNWLIENKPGIKSKKGGALGYHVCGVRTKTLPGMIAAIEKRNLEEKLQMEVYETWQKVYAEVPRKARVRTSKTSS